MREIHFFDLDGTLVNVKNYIWIIDKEDPSKPLYKMDNLEFNLVKYNFYKKDNLKVEYDDYVFYISKDIYEKVKRRKNISLDRLGISFREWKNRKFINSSEFEFLYKHIEHLSGSDQNDVKIAILTARPDRNKHSYFLNKLRIILKNLGLNLYKTYFVGDKFEIYHKEYLGYRKTIVLLEHLIGLKIKDNKFIKLRQDKFDNVFFYDDSIINIESSNSIQNIFNEIFSNSEEEIKEIISKRLEEKPLLINNLISSNKINRFETSKIVLTSPIKYPIIIEKFNDFGIDS